MNRKSEAAAILWELRSQQARGRMTHVAQALVHTALGNNDEAVRALERGWTERDDAVPFIALEPRLRPLHPEPRFQRLLKKIVS
jgi:hypothetical protein